MSKPEPVSPLRTYAVETDGIAGFRMVRARSQAQARNHVAAETIKVRLATADDGYEAGKGGIAIEDAVEATPVQAPSSPLIATPIGPDEPIDDAIESRIPTNTVGASDPQPAAHGDLD